MNLIVDKTDKITGEVTVPSSKSHTIRAFIFASLADGKSTLHNALESKDTKAAISACSALGAGIEKKETGDFIISGFNGKPIISIEEINTLNSGTTTNLISSVIALQENKIRITGDDSIKKRTMQPLLSALNNLGAEAISLNNNGCPPIEIKGILKGGSTELNCKSSQYLSSLLITCPLIKEDTTIELVNICEKPYIELTLRWLDELGIRYENNNFRSIRIPGNQSYKSFEKNIPGDWSSATFLLVAGAILGENLTINGLDIKDTQADKEVIEHLVKMGADIKIEEDKIIINKSVLKGCELDLNNTPDALPAIAVLACFAQGRTIIKNVAHARLKETDRIKVMVKELTKMGADIEEFDDGMAINHSNLKGCKVQGYNDHRVVMALSIAGMFAKKTTNISTAESIDITFPGYVEMMNKLNANIKIIK